MSIVFTGGGTGGSLAGLIAISSEFRKLLPDVKQHFIAPIDSIGKKRVESEHIIWHEIPAGKLDRYFSIKNIFLPFKIFSGYLKARKLLKTISPRIIVTAGSYVSPPIVWAGALKNASIAVIQLDVDTGLANKLMIPFADKIFVTFIEQTEKYKKAKLTGAPVHIPVGVSEIDNFINNKPIIMVVGGGTGAEKINKLIWEALPKLTKNYNIIHITGHGKENHSISENDSYKQYSSFFDDNGKYHTWLKKASIVISRAGIGTLADLSYYHMPTILIPIPNSHQEKNASYALSQNAVRILHQSDATPSSLLKEIDIIMNKKDTKEKLRTSIDTLMYHDANKTIAEDLRKLYENKY